MRWTHRGAEQDLPKLPGLMQSEKGTRGPVSRVLCSDRVGVVAIYLAPMLPPGSCDQPEDRPGVPMSSYSVLLRVGFALPSMSPSKR